jgi:hypothetical protein
MTSQELRNVTAFIKDILEREPIAREDDHMLAAKIWAEQNPRIRTDPTYSAKAFLVDLINGKYVKQETIRRSRQQLQEKDPSLRGRNYSLRKKTGHEVKQSINNQ